MADSGNTTVGGLEIEISASSTDAAAKIHKLVKSLERLSKVNVSGKNFDKIADKLGSLKMALSGLEDVGERLNTLAEGLSKLSQAGKFSITDKQIEKLSGLGVAVNDLPDAKNLVTMADGLSKLGGLEKINIPKSLPDRLRDLGTSMESVSDEAIARLERATEALQRLSGVNLTGVGAAVRAASRGASGAAAQTEPPTSDAGETSQDTSEFGRVSRLHKILESLKSAAAGAGGVLKKTLAAGLSAVGSAAQAAWSGVKKLGSSLADLVKSGISKGFKSLGGFIKKQLTGPLTGAISTITKWKNAIGRIAFYRIIRGAIKAVTDGFKTGIKDLYQYSLLANTEFAPAMDKLATASLYLKNSLGAMAAPLIQAVAPAVDFLVDKFVALLNVIGKAMAALTGKDVYTQARKHAVAYEDAAKGAAGAAKDFKKYLIGIDELNIINDDKGSGVGASAAEDYGSMFEEVEVPVETTDWAKKIREAIERGDWRGAGAALAEKLNSVLDSWDSYAWGESLASKVNNGLNAIYGFMTTFNFENIGVKLASGLNGIFDNLDWDLLGRTFATKWNALTDTIYGFVTTFNWADFGLNISEAVNGWFDEIDWAKAGTTFSEALKGILTSINVFLENTDWQAIGNDIAEFLRNVDWSGIADAVFEGIGAAIAGIGAFIWGVIEGAWNDVVDWWHEVAFEDGKFTMQGLLDGIWQKIKDIGAWIKEHIFQPFINGFKKAFGISSPSTVMAEQGKYIVEGLLNGVKNAWGSVVNFFSEKLSSITSKISEAWTKIKDNTSTAWANVKTTLGSKLSEISSSVSSTFSNIVSKATSWGKDLCSNMANGINAAKSWVSSAVSSVADKIKGFLGFSEPEEGPLSNFHTYMPDMLKLMAKGIRENTYLATGAVSDLAKSVSSEFSTMAVEAPKPRFSGVGEMQMNYQMAYAGGPNSSGSYEDSTRGANQEVISVIFAAAQQIIRAIEEKDTSVRMDGRDVTSRVTDRQNRNNRMYGKTLQNV